MSHPTEREAEEAIGRDLARRIAPLEPVLTAIPILHGILLGKRPNLFLFLFLLASAFYWWTSSTLFQKFVIFITTFTILAIFVEFLRQHCVDAIAKLGLASLTDNLIMFWSRKRPPVTERRDDHVITMEEARAKLIRFLTFVFVRIEKLRGGNKFDMYKFLGGIPVLGLLLYLWKYYILSFNMSFYWLTVLGLCWPQLKLHQVPETLSSLRAHYELQLTHSLTNTAATIKQDKNEEEEEDDFGLDEGSLGVALTDELEENDNQTQPNPTEKIEREETGSLFGLDDIDEMPSAIHGNEDEDDEPPSDDEWALDAESPSLADEMRLTAGLEFPSLSQDSVDYHHPHSHRRRKPIQRVSQLGNIPEKSKLVTSTPATETETRSRRKLPQVPVEKKTVEENLAEAMETDEVPAKKDEEEDIDLTDYEFVTASDIASH